MSVKRPLRGPFAWGLADGDDSGLAIGDHLAAVPETRTGAWKMWPRLTGACFSLSMVAAILGAQAAFAQTSYPCVNDAPDPYQRGASFASLPDGRAWGSTAV